MTWDEPKRQANIKDHGLDFADARERFEWETAVVTPSYPGKGGQARFKALGWLDGHLVGLVFSLIGTEAISASAYALLTDPKGSAMTTKTKRNAPMVSDKEEARVQAGIVTDPENPEWTDDDFARARPASEVVPQALYAALTRPRGRPKAAETKVPVKLRLDRAAVDAFKSSGPGWQTRMNEVIIVAAKSLRIDFQEVHVKQAASTRGEPTIKRRRASTTGAKKNTARPGRVKA